MGYRSIRPIRIDGNIAFVPLTKGYEAIIDAVDVPMVEGFNWKAEVTPHTVYVTRSHWLGNGKRRTVRMHRVIMGEPNRLEIDHIDGNGLNNRKRDDGGNLRVVTHLQNTHNQRTRSNNTSGFKGVSWHKASSKWRAQIKLNGRQRFLGLYATAETAHEAYQNASEHFHGDFGRTA